MANQIPVFKSELTVVSVNGSPAFYLDEYQAKAPPKLRFRTDDVVTVVFSMGNKTYRDVVTVQYANKHDYVKLRKGVEIGESYEATIKLAETPRYEKKGKRILRIGNSLAFSIDDYQSSVSAERRFKVGDMAYLHIEKEGLHRSGAVPINTYGSTYVVYLNINWGFKASDVVDVVLERMLD